MEGRSVVPSGASAEAPEVPVERMPYSDEEARSRAAQRFKRSFGPVLAGLVIDLVDFATIGPLQPILGLPVGTLCGWSAFGPLRMPTRQRLSLALACGLYCALPVTNFIPFATILGAFARVIWSDDEPAR